MNSTLRNLSIKNLKMNKSKSRLVVIAIILSTCLITAISILCYSMQQSKIRTIIEKYGDSHVMYRYLTDEQLEQLKNNKKLSNVREHIYLGVNKEYLPYTIRLASQDQDPDRIDNRIKDGTWPQKYNEIAMSEWIIKEIGKEPKVGEKIELFYLYDDKDVKQDFYGEFVISAILQDNEEAGLIADLVVSKEYAIKNAKDKYRSISVVAKCKGINIESIAEEVGEKIGLKDRQIKLNQYYLNALGSSKEAIKPFLIVTSVVVLATVLVIYSIFNISIKERVTQLGILAGLGATKKQIRRLIFREGLILALIGIPLGIVLGHILSYIIIPVIPLNIKLKVTTSPIIILIVIIIILLTIVISLRRPSKVASKISPIEAIRYTGVENGSNKKERKSVKNISISKLAYFNILRNKKRTLITIVSMTLTGVLFITFYSMYQGLNSKVEPFITYPLELRSTNLNENDLDKGTNPLNRELIYELKNIDGVKGIGVLKYARIFNKDKNLIKQYNDLITIEDRKVKEKIGCDFFGYNDFLFKDLKDRVIEGEIDLEKFKNNNLVVLERAGYVKDQYPKVGDKVTITYESNGNEVDIEVMVAAVINKNSRNIGWKCMGGTFIMAENMFSKVIKDERVSEVCIDVKDTDFKRIKDNVNNLIKDNKEIKIFDKFEYKKRMDNELRTMGLVAFALVSIIGLIGVLNTINTMNTSILSRKKELGMLEAVGITSKQLRKLFRIEGLYYSLASIGLSSILGTGISRILFSYLKEMYGPKYELPIIGVLVIAVIFIGVQLLITYNVERKLKKDSIVDKIRFNE